MRILMYGYGKGNNIEPWLDFFQRNDTPYKLTFICDDFSYNREGYTNIKIIELNKKSFSLIYLFIFLIRNQFDVLYIHGLYDFAVRITLLLFSKTRIKCLNIWNNNNYKRATRLNRNIFKRRCYHFLLSRVDRLYFTWYGTKIEFEKFFPEFKSKIHLNPWGLRKKVLDLGSGIIPEDDFTKHYLNKIKSGEFFIFWPETMSEHEHVHTFIQALKILKNKYPLRVLLFCGHQNDQDRYIIYLKSLIRELELNFVDLKMGHYISFSDIMAIWERSDLAIKLSTKDQLSSGILESLYFRNPMILNDWIPYKKLKEMGLMVYLTELSPEEIAKHLSELLQKLKKDKHYFHRYGEKNRAIIKKHFNFEENIQNIFNRLGEELLK